MTQDQVFVPPTRSELGLPPFDPSKEDLLGARVISEVKKEMWEALGDSPIGAALQSASYLVSLSPSIRLLKHSFCIFTARRLACLHHNERLWSKEVSKGHHSSVYSKVWVKYLEQTFRLQPRCNHVFSPSIWSDYHFERWRFPLA